MKLKKVVSAVLATVIVSTSMVFSLATVNALDTPAFDESNITLRMPVLSDAHIGASANFSSQHLQSALDTYNKYGKLDAMMFAGDFIDYGTEDQVKYFSELLTSKVDLTKTRLIPGIGNHELYNYSIQQNPFDVPQNLVKYLGADKVYQGATAEEIAAGNYVTSVNGITLLTVNCWTYSGGVKFRQEDLDWLSATLAKTDSTKPVFIATHPAVQGTHWGSNYGAYWATTDQDLYNILKQYPNATVFSGHLHFPVTNDSIIWQGDFTTVGTGSVSYASLEDKDASGSPYLGMSGSEPSDAQSISNGLLVEVDKNGNTRITRIDFITGKEIKAPFYIDAPKNDKTHLNRYSKETVDASNTAPSFAESATVTAEKAGTDGSSIKIAFDAATDNDMVYAYEITFYDTVLNKAVKTRSAYSDFYNVDKASDMAKKVNVTINKRDLGSFNSNYKNDWKVEIKAVDCFGLKSNVIASEIYKGTGQVTEPDVVDINVKPDWGYRAYGNFDAYSVGYELKQSADFNCYPTPEMEGAPTKLPISASGNQNSNALVTKLNSTNGFFDVLFGVGGKGYKIDQIGASEFWVWIDASNVTLNNLHFGFRTENVYGAEYYTYYNSDANMKAYIQEGDSWKEISFANGYMNIANYKGFIRFSSDYFVSQGGKEILWPTDLAGFLYGYNSTTAESVGKTFTIDEIGFAGSQIEKPNTTVGGLLKGDLPSSFEDVNEPTMKDTTYVTFMDFEHEMFEVNRSLAERDDKGLLINPASNFAGTPEEQFGTYFDMTIVNKKINGTDSKAVKVESYDKEYEGKPNSGLYTELIFKPSPKIDKPLQLLPTGKNIPSDSETHGFMFYVDTTEYQDGSLSCQGIFKELDYNDDGTKYITYDDDGEPIENVTFRSFAPGGEYFMEDPATGKFVKAGIVDNSNYINLPADYAGYIKIPFSSLNLAWGSKDVNNKFDLQKFISFSLYYGCYPTRLGAIYYDDFGFYGETFKEDPYIVGDADLDGKITTLDSLTILKHVAEMEKITGTNLAAADYNKDGVVNTLDALGILRKIAKLD